MKGVGDALRSLNPRLMILPWQASGENNSKSEWKPAQDPEKSPRFSRPGQALPTETVGLDLAAKLSHLSGLLLLPQLWYLPAPLHEVFLKQDLGLQTAVAAFGFLCQVVEPGVGQALFRTHSGTEEKAVW